MKKTMKKLLTIFVSFALLVGNGGTVFADTSTNTTDAPTAAQIKAITTIDTSGIPQSTTEDLTKVDPFSAKGKTYSNYAISIKSFGAHSIDETGYSTFDSSVAINNAIQFAIKCGSKWVDFGSGRFYAKNIKLLGNMTYFSTQGAELIAAPDITTCSSVLSANKQANIKIEGLTINGNKSVVYGCPQSGIFMISFNQCNNITVQNCYLHNSKYLGILMQNGCYYVNVNNNTIYDTDCGIIATHGAGYNITIDKNTVYGSKENQTSEPIAIYNSNSTLAHDITITNNTVHDKLNASGIFVMNTTKATINNNVVYNCSNGIMVGVDGTIKDSAITVSSWLTISENNVRGCVIGIGGELNNSTISSNTIQEINNVGIWLLSKNSTVPINNDKIYKNTLTNVNKIGAQEPAIRLQKASNCTIDSNNIYDLRNPILDYWGIHVCGSSSNGNVIKNETKSALGPVKGYNIWVQGANNTQIIMPTTDKPTYLDQGTGTTITTATN